MAILQFEGGRGEGGGKGEEEKRGRRRRKRRRKEEGGEEMKGLTQEKSPLFQVELEHAKANEMVESAGRPRSEQALSLPHCVILNTPLDTHSDLTSFLIK